MVYRTECQLMMDAARAAGAVLMRHFGGGVERQTKGYLDLVTAADFESERLILSAIRSTFPGDAVVAEESGAAGDGERRWYIDPLDGTINFAHGVPLFAVTIAFWDAEGPACAVVFNPAHGECYTAERGEGACLNGQSIVCSPASNLADALIFINPHGLKDPNGSEALLEVYRKLGGRSQAILNLGSMSLALCSIAAGRIDGGVALDVDQFSTPASALILAEAGARVTDIGGRHYQSDATTLICAGDALHRELCSLMGGGGL